MDIWSRGAGDYFEELPKEQAYGTATAGQEETEPELWGKRKNGLREQERQTENRSVMAAEQEQLYIGYSGKLRVVIDRFDSIIRELRLKEKGLEGEKKRRKNDLEGTRWFVIIGAVLWVLAAFFIVFLQFGSFNGRAADTRLQKLVPVFVFVLIPLLFYTVWILIKFLRARKAYKEYMKEKSFDNSKNNMKTYYEKQSYYIKCISVMEKRQKMYKTILEKLEKGEAITEKEIGLLKGISDDIYRIPELGFTFYEM